MFCVCVCVFGVLSKYIEHTCTPITGTSKNVIIVIMLSRMCGEAFHLFFCFFLLLNRVHGIAYFLFDGRRGFKDYIPLRILLGKKGGKSITFDRKKKFNS